MKTALITGASSGIGKELAIIHAQKGGDLVLVARRVEQLYDLKNKLEKQFNIKVFCIQKDLSVPGSGKEVYQEIKDQNIEIEFLMNNAGFGLLGKFHGLPWERQLQMINLNITTLTELTYLFLQDFTKKNSGKILNTSSTASFMPGPLQAVYYASKAFVTFFSNALAEELHDTNITVTALTPGATETEFGATSGMDKTDIFKNLASSKSVALDGYNGMIEGKIDVVTGMTFPQKMMMASLPLIPKKMLLKQVRNMQEVK